MPLVTQQPQPSPWHSRAYTVPLHSPSRYLAHSPLISFIHLGFLMQRLVSVTNEVAFQLGIIPDFSVNANINSYTPIYSQKICFDHFTTLTVTTTGNHHESYLRIDLFQDSHHSFSSSQSPCLTSPQITSSLVSNLPLHMFYLCILLTTSKFSIKILESYFTYIHFLTLLLQTHIRIVTV